MKKPEGYFQIKTTTAKTDTIHNYANLSISLLLLYLIFYPVILFAHEIIYIRIFPALYFCFQIRTNRK